MAKYSEKLVEKIVKLMEEDNLTVTQICDIVGISRKMFYQWRTEKPIFKEALANAEEVRDEKIKILARRALRNNLEGVTKIETKKVYIPDKDGNNSDKLILKEYVVKEKRCEPDVSAINHTLIENKREKAYKDDVEKGLSTSFAIYVQDEKTRGQLKGLEHKEKSENILSVTSDK